MHYKTSLTTIRLELMSYYNVDGRPKMTDTQKKVFGSTKMCTAIIGKK